MSCVSQKQSVARSLALEFVLLVGLSGCALYAQEPPTSQKPASAPAQGAETQKPPEKPPQQAPPQTQLETPPEAPAKPEGPDGTKASAEQVGQNTIEQIIFRGNRRIPAAT